MTLVARRRLRRLTRTLLTFVALFGLIAVATPKAQEVEPPANPLIESLSNLDAVKLNQLYEHIGIEPSPDFFGCLCRGDGGYHYWGQSEGSCRRIGALGGVSFEGFDMGRFESCSAAYPLPDGRTVIEAVTEAASPAEPEVCPAPQSEAEARAASPFGYDPWPPMFNDVPSENVFYELTADDRAKLKGLADGASAFGNRIVDLVLGGASKTIRDMTRVAARTGYNVMSSSKTDLRIDFELGEIAFKVNPQTGRLEVTEYLFKWDVFGEGRNLEVAWGQEGATWDGKVKLGFSTEQDLPGLGQVEAKFGFDYDSRAVLTTSLDDEPVPVSPSRLDKVWTGLQSYLAGVDFYFGAAAGPGVGIGEHQISVGPESTFYIKEAYSDALFAEMLTAMDAALEQQKAVEEKRHEYIRRLARQLGVPNATCGTMGEVMTGIQQRLYDEARRQGIPTEGKSIKEIRDALMPPVSGSNTR